MQIAVHWLLIGTQLLIHYLHLEALLQKIAKACSQIYFYWLHDENIFNEHEKGKSNTNNYLYDQPY